MSTATTTRRRHDSIRNDGENNEKSNDGVQLNSLIGSVLGVDFLPFDSRLASVASSSSWSLSSDDENAGKKNSQNEKIQRTQHNNLKCGRNHPQDTNQDTNQSSLPSIKIHNIKRNMGKLDVIRKNVVNQNGDLDTESAEGAENVTGFKDVGSGKASVKSTKNKPSEKIIVDGGMLRINELLIRTDDDSSDLNDYRACVHVDSENNPSFASSTQSTSDTSFLSLSDDHDDDKMSAIRDPEDAKPPLKGLPSLLRIHDLDLPQEANRLFNNSDIVPTNPNDFERLSTRSDLYSLNQTDRFLVLHALLRRGLAIAIDEGIRWTPDRSTSKHEATEHDEPSMPSPWHFPQLGQDPMVWSGSLDDRPGYGNEICAIKARAILYARPNDVLTLLMDNDKVQDYNSMCLGRMDKYVFDKDENMDSGLDDTAVARTRVIRTLTNVAILRKKFELMQILHMETLEDQGCGMKGWIVVTRSLWETGGDVPPTTNNTLRDNDGFIRSEMLMSVIITREVLVDEESGNIGFEKEGTGKKVMTELTTVTHFKAPGMPAFGAKQFALKAASGFISKIRDRFPASEYKEEMPISSGNMDDNYSTKENDGD